MTQQTPSPSRPARAKTAGERQRQPTEIRRGLIVEAARGVIAERGPFATTMRDIATAAAVSLGTVTYHFSSGIAEILAHVLQGEMDSFYLPIAERAHAAADAASGMRALVDGFFADDLRTAQHWRLWLDFWSLSAHDAAHAQWQETAYEQWRTDVRKVLARGVESGEFRLRDLDLVLADFLVAFDGLAVQAYLPGSKVGPAQARAYLHGWVDRHLFTTP
ncbi:TetR/AcrR family transcriptional regulator [Actinospica sp.]|jgi:AcrR family transcriptional regulator|uniref:TetR/AcrR family transcriptional regulator n=1 Tax=Actinospica sp. TaxID=1872142 RepID=UPI002CCF4307|nr:TetR/AcrR family transcriptional regulator [Actinospica sp.]HWG22492.1 TetR/AcrR family transcriptional regulator [Actinospica sp.]